MVTISNYETKIRYIQLKKLTEDNVTNVSLLLPAENSIYMYP